MVGTTPSWELLKITIADGSRERVKAVSDRPGGVGPESGQGHLQRSSRAPDGLSLIHI